MWRSEDFFCTLKQTQLWKCQNVFPNWVVQGQQQLQEKKNKPWSVHEHDKDSKAARESMSQLGNTGFLLSITDVFQNTFVPILLPQGWKHPSVKMKKFVTTWCPIVSAPQRMNSNIVSGCSQRFLSALTETWWDLQEKTRLVIFTGLCLVKRSTHARFWTRWKKKVSGWRCWVYYPCMTEVPAGLRRCGFKSSCGSSLPPSVRPDSVVCSQTSLF